MAHDTRSRRKRLQQSSPPSQQQTRKHPNSRVPAQESKRQRGKKDSRRRLSNSLVISSLSESSSQDSSSESEASSTPSPALLSRKPLSSKRQRHNENRSVNIISSSISQEADSNIQPAHIQITHFDFTKYQAERPSTPLIGSESNPFKIEDSPDASLSLPIRSQAPSAHRQPHAQLASRTEGPIIQHNSQARNLGPVDIGRSNDSSFMISSVYLMPSQEVASIVMAPDASIAFLRCFLAAEKHWLRSCDHDMDIDKVFWRNIAKQFNRSGLDYHIDKAETARTIASTLCSPSHIAYVKQQQPRGDDVLLRLVSALDDCHCMSLRRRRQQQLGLEHVQSLIENQVTEEVVEKGILTKIPQNLKEYDNIIGALRLKEANKAGAAAATAVGSPGVADRERQKKGSFKPRRTFTANFNTQSMKRKIIKPNKPRNVPSGPQVMRQIPNRRIGQRASHRAQDRPWYPSARISNNRFGGTTSIEHYQQQKIHHLERQLKEAHCRKQLF